MNILFNKNKIFCKNISKDVLINHISTGDLHLLR